MNQIQAECASCGSVAFGEADSGIDVAAVYALVCEHRIENPGHVVDVYEHRHLGV